MKQHKTLWTVIYPNRHYVYFETEEAARHEAYLYGMGLIAPLYR